MGGEQTQWHYDRSENHPRVTPAASSTLENVSNPTQWEIPGWSPSAVLT